MLFKSVLLATFATLAFAAPGGEYDHGDWNWGKDKCYVKHVTYYQTSTAYKDDVEWAKKTVTKDVEYPSVTKIPVTKVEYVEKYIKVTKKVEDVQKYPVTKKVPYPVVQSQVKDEKVCKTKWWGNHWGYQDKEW